MTHFSDKERTRFRKLLEVANSSSFKGEKEAALEAATRMAESHGMTLREAAGMAERIHRPRDRQTGSPRAAAFYSTFGTWHVPRETYRTESERVSLEKQNRNSAMADAIGRGLDQEELKKENNRRNTYTKRIGKGAWRARPDFIRVLLIETSMSVKEISEVVGVSVHDVFKEKLLMRRA